MDTIKRTVYAGTLADSSETLKTIKNGQTFQLESITLTNKTDASATATILLNDIEIISAHTIEARDTLNINDFNIVLNGEATIKGLASAASTINCFITGQVTG